MSQERLAPQQPEECLTLSRKSRCRGGTVIAPGVWTIDEHRRRLADPSRPYRPVKCPKCGCGKLHVQDYRERHPLGILMVAVLVVARFICVNPQCKATWRVLPEFLARHLWWPWKQIEQVTIAAVAVTPTSTPETATMIATPAIAALQVPRSTEDSKARAPSVRTRQRWRGRLGSSARQLVELLAKHGGAVLDSVAQAVGLDSNRMQLVGWYADAMRVEVGRQLASVGARMHELEPGVRLM